MLRAEFAVLIASTEMGVAISAQEIGVTVGTLHHHGRLLVAVGSQAAGIGAHHQVLLLIRRDQVMRLVIQMLLSVDVLATFICAVQSSSSVICFHNVR